MSTTTMMMETVIGSSCVIEGPVRSSQNTRIAGQVKGNIFGTSTILIDSSGQVTGNVVAQKVIVGGHLDGNIRANEVVLQKTCTMKGDIVYHDSITMEPGCVIDGKITKKEEQDVEPEPELKS